MYTATTIFDPDVLNEICPKKLLYLTKKTALSESAASLFLFNLLCDSGLVT